MSKMLIQVDIGQRVKVKTSSGIKQGTVQRIDEAAPPFGKVIVKTDDGETVEVPIGIGGV